MTTAHIVSFSETLRKRTRSQHQVSAGAGFMSDLMRGHCSLEEYSSLIAQYWFVYGALERAAVTMAHDPVASPFVTERLTRLPALESDLEFLVGSDWRDRILPLSATQAYVDRLETVASKSAGAFVAHHYTRYLGDLSGGQFIKTVLQRHYGFGTNGVGFYIFSEVADPSEFKSVYRSQLDAAPWTDAQKEDVVDEVLLAYAMNTALLAALDRDRREIA